MSAPRLESLPAVQEAVWRELGLAARSKGHGWRIGVLATVAGDAADARCVVLREVDAAAQAILIFTDSRSAKARQLQAHPRGMLVLWSAPLAWQLRLSVAMSMETDGLRVSSRWAQLKATPAAQDYLSPQPPGSVISAEPNPPRSSRDHFAVIAARVVALDWLELHPEGHRRARFDEAGAAWVTP